MNARSAPAGLVDFDDLIALPVRLLTTQADLAAHYRARWPHLSVDEYQDIDAQQYQLVRLLASSDANPEHGRGTGCSLCAIGDPDQAIYGFRGTDVRFFQQFQADYPAARIVCAHAQLPLHPHHRRRGAAGHRPHHAGARPRSACPDCRMPAASSFANAPPSAPRRSLSSKPSSVSSAAPASPRSTRAASAARPGAPARSTISPFSIAPMRRLRRCGSARALRHCRSKSGPTRRWLSIQPC